MNTRSAWPKPYYPEGPSTQYLRTLVPNTIKSKVFGTRNLKYWVLGPSGLINPHLILFVLGPLPRPPNVALFRALWSLLDGIWGFLKGSWGVLVVSEKIDCDWRGGGQLSPPSHLLHLPGASGASGTGRLPCPIPDTLKNTKLCVRECVHISIHTYVYTCIGTRYTS